MLLIETIQAAVLEGVQQLLVYPRGSGKTSVARRAIQWSALYGHRQYAMLFAAEATKARQHIESIKKDFLTNDMIYGDFPEIAEPVWQCEGIAQRANFQTYQGVSTGLIWGGSGIRFPVIDDFQKRGNSGCALACGTITGAAARGPLLENMRPDFAIIDDPQTRKSAKSPSQVEERSDIIEGDILGMAGPGKNMSAVMTATVIYPDDLADQYLGQERHPDWNGIRVSMIESWPTDTEKWDTWYDLVRQAKIDRIPLTKAHEFYKKNRKKMDAGASVYWEDRCRDGYVSALESAMERHYRNPNTFASEYQNKPIERIGDESGLPKASELDDTRQIPLRRGVVPEWAVYRTAMIDVQKKALYYVEMAWAQDCTGHISDYGTWPDQRRKYYTLSDIKRTMLMASPGAGMEGALYSALNKLMDKIESSHDIDLDRGIIDANWGETTDVVYRVCRERGKNIWYPSHGQGFRVTKRPFNEGPRKTGDLVGSNWRIPRIKSTPRRQRHLLYETNFWKSFSVERWRVPVGDPGAMTVFKASTHQVLWDQLHAEYGQAVESNGRTMIEWSAKPNQDNHFFDCVVGNCVAASTLGCVPPGAVGVSSQAKRSPARPRAEVHMSASDGRSFFVTAR